ncbi:hypothetical protein DERP_010003 [Dermatophagoides pteronyssinus]|uniref:Uncharacterized protein n=1 Tax=Dermatophagoides pteronyssinus TaxID=6956 RepID=A0ABQ8J252_DERPT|nr:hypothetical protein DERP_010003 [Dermatophagoides pteronyssinus]
MSGIKDVIIHFVFGLSARSRGILFLVRGQSLCIEMTRTTIPLTSCSSSNDEPPIILKFE